MTSEKQDSALKGHRQGNMLERLKVMKNLADPQLGHAQNKALSRFLEQESALLEQQSSSLSPRSRHTTQAHQLQAGLPTQTYPNHDNQAQLEAEIQQFEKRNKLLAGLH